MKAFVTGTSGFLGHAVCAELLAREHEVAAVWERLATQRGKRRTIVAVAVARELAGFCWALANAD